MNEDAIVAAIFQRVQRDGMIGPQAGLTGHISLGRMARVGAQAGVMGDVEAGAEVVGSPAQPRRAFFREVAIVRRLARAESKAGKRAGSAGRTDKETDTD